MAYVQGYVTIPLVNFDLLSDSSKPVGGWPMGQASVADMAAVLKVTKIDYTEVNILVP